MVAEQKERIAKVIARAGYCSRRDAERLIEEGVVMVDGVKVTTPATKISHAQDITIRGKVLPKPGKSKLWLFNKPIGVLTTHKDPRGRRTIFDVLPKHLPHVVTVGRLDFNSEGLLLLTNDGELARRMTLPATGLVRCYRVRAFGRLEEQKLEQLRRGVTIEGVRYQPAEIAHESSRGKNHWFEVKIKEGKNREIRKLFDYAGLTVNRLIRTGYGPYQLKNLASGAVLEVPVKGF